MHRFLLPATHAAAAPRRSRRVHAPRCAAAAEWTELEPLRPLSASLVALTSPGVYRVYDVQRRLQYIGVTRKLCDSLAGHAEALPSELASFASMTALPGASGAALQAAWRAAVAEHGAVPPGNAPGADARWAAKPRAGAAAAAAPRLAADTDVARWSSDAVDALITPAVTEQLRTRGFAVLEGVLSTEACDAVLRACAALEPHLVAIASQQAQGRNDKSAGVRLPAPGAAAVTLLSGAATSDDTAPLAHAASLLMALPHALSPHVPTPLAPPQSLQLALYAGSGAHYSRHVDNPGSDAPGARDGPPGWRTSDRCVTGIVYFNTAWEAAHGGKLRLWPPLLPKRETPVDLEPRAGRLVLFDSASVEHEVLPAHAPRWALSAWMPRLDAFS